VASQEPAGTVIWDFDGTLGYSASTWSAVMPEVLDAFEPGHGLTLAEIRPQLSYGFPWHAPGSAHLDLCEAGRWWANLETILAAALSRPGLPASAASRLAGEVRPRYLAPERWRLFGDTVPALASLTSAG
jgi:phosphoglycolate phosphatase-like HAD superfamily hydrolase